MKVLIVTSNLLIPYGSAENWHLPKESDKKDIPNIANIRKISKITTITSKSGPRESNRASKIIFKFWL